MLSVLELRLTLGTSFNNLNLLRGRRHKSVSVNWKQASRKATLAGLQGAKIEDMILKAAKSSLSACLTEQVTEILDNPNGFGIHKLLGGEDSG